MMMSTWSTGNSTSSTLPLNIVITEKRIQRNTLHIIEHLTEILTGESQADLFNMILFLNACP